jgi:hypothetical protein
MESSLLKAHSGLLLKVQLVCNQLKPFIFETEHRFVTNLHKVVYSSSILIMSVSISETLLNCYHTRRYLPSWWGIT